MDPPLPLPGRLVHRPDPGAPGIAGFDPVRQAAPLAPHFAGLQVLPDFLGPDEARRLLAAIEREPFHPAQSGKRKQHFGPRFNFNERRMKAAGLAGLPGWALELAARARSAPTGASEPGLARVLAAFEPADVFVLRYEEAERSNLDLHVDDLWAYGEAILDVSLESDTVLTFVRGSGDELRCVRAPLPARSLAVLHGPARTTWEHGVLWYDVRGRRTSVTLRSLGARPAASEEGRRVRALAAAARASDPDAGAPGRRATGSPGW